MKKTPFLLFSFIAVLAIGCSSDEDIEEPELPPHTGLAENRIIISGIQGIPGDVVFDRVSVNISGKWWDVILTLSASCIDNVAVLELPSFILPELLNPAQRSETERGLGYWPTESADPSAGIAALNDIIAYNGNEKVGRLYLTDWSGEGSTAGKAYVYYQYADKEFSLSGYNKYYGYGKSTPPGFKVSYSYSATFRAGWNAYANINSSSTSGVTNCTTEIAETLQLEWHFESWN